MAVEIHRMLAVSTAHIRPETARFLDEDDSPVIAYRKADVGWFVALTLTPEERQILESKGHFDLLQLFDYARGQGCSWIMLDRDVPPLDNLPTYNW